MVEFYKCKTILLQARTAASQRTAVNALRETNSDIVKVLQAVRALHGGIVAVARIPANRKSSRKRAPEGPR